MFDVFPSNLDIVSVFLKCAMVKIVSLSWNAAREPYGVKRMNDDTGLADFKVFRLSRLNEFRKHADI